MPGSSQRTLRSQQKRAYWGAVSQFPANNEGYLAYIIIVNGSKLDSSCRIAPTQGSSR